MFKFIILFILPIITYPCQTWLLNEEVSVLYPKAKDIAQSEVIQIDKVDFHEIDEEYFKRLPKGSLVYNQKGESYLKGIHKELGPFFLKKQYIDKQLSYEKFLDSKYFAKTKIKEMRVGEYLKFLEKFNNKTFIFIDIETTGFLPTIHQVTEVYANKAKFKFEKSGKTKFESVDSFHQKAKLNANTQSYIEYQKNNPDKIKVDEKTGKKALTTEEILKMTNYYEMDSAKLKLNSERVLLADLLEFIGDGKDNVIVMQNAYFDWNFLNERSLSKSMKAIFNKSLVLDTKHMIKYFWIPIMENLSLQKTSELKGLSKALKEKKSKDIKRAKKSIKTIKKVSEKTGKTSYSASMGVVTTALEIENKDWHAADADVFMMIEMMQKIYKDLVEFKDLEIK